MTKSTRNLAARVFHVERRAGPLTLALLACVAADAATAPALDPALLKRLEAVDAKAADIHSMSADFEQKKFTPLLKHPLVSRGTVTAAGDAMLWDTTAPEPTKLRIDGHSLRLLYLQQKVLEEYPLQGKMATLAAGPLPRLATLREKFDVAPDPQAAPGTLSLLLIPRDAELKQYVDTVRVTLDEQAGVVKRFELTDPDGERTEITFTAPKLNADAPNATDLDVPAGTKTVRPLGPASGSP